MQIVTAVAGVVAVLVIAGVSTYLLTGSQKWKLTAPPTLAGMSQAGPAYQAASPPWSRSSRPTWPSLAP